MKINVKFPLLVIPKMGTLKLGGKTFTYDDISKGIIPITQFVKDMNWYGGRVKSFGKTKENFLLCIEDKKVIGIYFPNEKYLDSITSDGLKLLENEGVIDEVIYSSNISNVIIENPIQKEEESTVKKRGRPRGGDTVEKNKDEEKEGDAKD